MLAPLDNEVVFKKAFTDRSILKALVKDIIGIDFKPGKIETEKQFLRNPGNIDQKYDIYCESVDHRIVVELQRVEYDYHFDRFLYYHNMAIAELQESCKKYKLEKTIYTIVFLVQGFTDSLTKEGEPITDSVLISKANPTNLQGKEVNIYGHSLIFLNSFYTNTDYNIPAKYKDWLTLIRESIENKENYKVNEKKKAIKKVTKLINEKNLKPEERRKMKIAEETKAKEKIRIEQLKKRDEIIKEQDKELKDNKKAIEDKDKALEDNAKQIAELMEQLKNN